ASVTVLRATPSRRASSRLDGTASPGRSSPSAMAARTCWYTCRVRSPRPSTRTCSSTAGSVVTTFRTARRSDLLLVEPSEQRPERPALCGVERLEQLLLGGADGGRHGLAQCSTRAGE